MVVGSKQSLEVDLQTESAYGPYGGGDNPGFSAGESTFGVLNGSPVWRGIPIVEDGFNIGPSAQRAGENLKRNIFSQAPAQLTGFEVGGSLNPLATSFDKRTAYNRGVLNWLMGAAAMRNSSNQLRSYSMRWHTPGVSTQLILGAKCQSLTIEGSADSGIVSFSSEWVAAEHQGNAETVVTPVFPNITPQTPAGSSASARGWTFGRAYLLTNHLGGIAVVGEARSVTITINNNLTPGPTKVKTTPAAGNVVTDEYKLIRIDEGEQQISGSFVVDYIDREWFTALNADTAFSVQISMRHPQSRVFGVSSVSPSAGATFTLLSDTTIVLDTALGHGDLLTADADYNFEIGSAVMVEDVDPAKTVEAYKRDVALLKDEYKDAQNDIVTDAVQSYWSPSGIQLSTDPSRLVIYDVAAAIRINNCRIDTAALTGGPADIIGQDVAFTAGGSGVTDFLFAASSPANAIS